MTAKKVFCAGICGLGELKTMENAWQLFLRQLASGDLEFTYDDMCGWSADEFEALNDAGLISEVARATHLACGSCPEGHWERVRWSEDGKLAFIPCAAAGLVKVDLERLRRWRIDVARLAILLTEALELRSECLPIIAGANLWRLGRRRFGRQFQDFFFAVTPEDGLPAAIRAVDQSLVSGRGLLILPLQLKIDGIGEPARLKSLALSDIASWKNGKIALDLDFIEDIFTRDDAARAVRSVRSLPIPDNAKWDGVRIEVLDTALNIEIAGYANEISFQEAGFSERDQRFVTLKLLAACHGRLAADQVKPRPGKTPLKNRVHALRELLQALIPIDGRPIEHNKKAGVYVCKFHVRLAGQESFPTPASASWLDFCFVERRDGRLSVSVNQHKMFRARQSERSSGTPVHEVGQQAELVPYLYSLENLKLRGPKGKLAPVGTTLLELLRSKGRLKRRGDDMSVLKLGEWLREWIGLEGNPLRYSESTRSWTASFECSSEHGR